MLQEPYNKPELIILDDAYQHRYVDPDISILLVDYNRMITEDHLLPVGQLREPVTAKNRADTKWFSDVQVEIEYPEEDADGIVLVFTVAERPLLREIEIRGADEVTEEDLRILLDVHPGQMFGQPDVERMRQKILRKYREEGFMMAEVPASL